MHSSDELCGSVEIDDLIVDCGDELHDQPVASYRYIRGVADAGVLSVFKE